MFEPKEDPPYGAPGWVVTYSDMMSLLLTFFIMLVSLSDMKADKKYRAAVESIMKRIGYTAAPQAPLGPGSPLGALIEKLKTLASASDKSRGKGGVRKPGVPGKDNRTFLGREGTAIHCGEALDFKPGSSEISEASEPMLRLIAERLAGKPHKIEVRGHTSSAPLPEESEFKDKLTLSYERGRRVMEILEREGVLREQMRISAAGDNDPPPPSPDQAARREDRVVIYVLDAYARDFVGPHDSEPPRSEAP